MMQEELMKKAKEAKSVEELLTLAKENNYPLDEEGAKEIFCQLHTEGELDDDELGSVSGGGCTTYTKVNGQKFVVVTPDLKCFNGQFKLNYRRKALGGWELIRPYRGQENTHVYWWRINQKPFPEVCGNCQHLGLKGGIGYCELS